MRGSKVVSGSKVRIRERSGEYQCSAPAGSGLSDISCNREIRSLT